MTKWPDTILFAKLTWPEIKKAAEANAVALIVVAQIEEHGPHLPVDTDVLIGEAVTFRAAEILRNKNVPVVLLPTVWSAYSEVDVTRFPGTIVVRPIHLASLLTDICESLVRSGFRKIGFVNAHGQNRMAIEMAIRETRDRTGVSAAMFLCANPEARSKILHSIDIHGGEGETSLYLAIAPEYVDMDKAPKEPYTLRGKRSLSAMEAKQSWWTTWSIQKTKYGIFGDASLATKEKGEALLNAYAESLARMIEEYYHSPFVSPEEHGQ